MSSYKKLEFIIKDGGCHECTSHKLGNHGYPSIGQKINGVNYHMAHRFVYAKTFGNFDISLCVLHKCDNRKCINPDHLFLGDRVVNNKDRHKKGRTSKVARTNGLINGMCKLTPEQVIEIRLSKGCMSQSKLAHLYGVSQTNISRIQLNKQWRHL